MFKNFSFTHLDFFRSVGGPRILLWKPQSLRIQEHYSQLRTWKFSIKLDASLWKYQNVLGTLKFGVTIVIAQVVGATHWLRERARKLRIVEGEELSRALMLAEFGRSSGVFRPGTSSSSVRATAQSSHRAWDRVCVRACFSTTGLPITR